MKKQIVSMIIIVFIAVTSGCGVSGLPDDKDNPDEFVELVWYTNGQRPADMDVVLSTANEYLKNKLNCTLKIVFVGDKEYDTKLTTITTAGDKYDIANSLPNMFDYRVAAGVGYISPLNELLKKNTPALKQIINPIAWSAAQINGECYAIPANYGLAHQLTLVTRAPITNSNELMKTFARAHTEDPGIVVITNLGELTRAANLDYVVDGYFPAAVKFDDKTCRIINQFEDPNYIALLKTIRVAAQKQYYVKDMNAAESQNVFAANNAFSLIESLSYLDRFTKTKFNKANIIPLTANQRITALNVNASALVISATSAHPTRALRLIELLYADEYLKNLLTFGIENRHYEKTADGHIHFLTDHGNYLIEETAFGNAFLDYVPETQPLNKWQAVQEYDTSASVSPLAGFVVDVQPLKRLLPGLVNAVSKYQNGLRSGALDVDQAVAALIIDLKANGLDEFLQLLQNQVDSWRNRKT
ncbi:MAG: ABC transporter substrate-binding protein [Negativicutes bacterium]|jgi:putative aldouronate transport system substrate-binding protein